MPLQLLVVICRCVILDYEFDAVSMDIILSRHEFRDGIVTVNFETKTSAAGAKQEPT